VLKRWLFNGLAAMSLALCVAAAMLWVRSYFVWDAVGGCVSETPASETCVQASSNRGVISLRRFDLRLTGGRRRGRPGTGCVMVRDLTQSERDRGVIFPHWVVVLPAALLPGL
jgi:hypothetical protein